MPEPKVCEFSKHIADLCATRGTDVFRLGTKLGIEPDGVASNDQRQGGPNQGSYQWSAKELHSNVPFLTNWPPKSIRDVAVRIARNAESPNHAVGQRTAHWQHNQTTGVAVVRGSSATGTTDSASDPFRLIKVVMLARGLVAQPLIVPSVAVACALHGGWYERK
jgi:hypothetical protein